MNRASQRVDSERTPPSSHQGNEPLVFSWQILQEDSCIQDQVPASAKGAQADPNPEDNPIRGATRYDREDGADHERDVERKPPANDVG